MWFSTQLRSMAGTELVVVAVFFGTVTGWSELLEALEVQLTIGSVVSASNSGKR